MKTMLNKRIRKIVENGKRRAYSVHRLVAITFKSNPKNKPTVNHKDGNKLNNNVLNLEWATRSENTQHAYNTNLLSAPALNKFGVDNPSSKPVIQYSKNNVYIDEYVSLTEASEITKTDVSDISKVCKNKKKFAGGYIWKYKC